MKANLAIRAADGETLSVGKVVPLERGVIFHADMYGKYQRRTIGAWGVRCPIARWLDDHGIDEVYFWERSKGLYHVVSLATIRFFGVLGKPDKFGGTLNVPFDHWDTLSRGKLPVPWVHDQNTYILPPVLEAWPGIAPISSDAPSGRLSNGFTQSSQQLSLLTGAVWSQ